MDSCIVFAVRRLRDHARPTSSRVFHLHTPRWALLVPSHSICLGREEVFGSRPVSRILYPDGWWTFIWERRCRRPLASLPGGKERATPRGIHRLPPYLLLLPVGFTVPPSSPKTRCALTAPFHPYPALPGGLLSVALSVGSPRLAVSQHRALWSPDFPPGRLPRVRPSVHP